MKLSDDDLDLIRQSDLFDEPYYRQQCAETLKDAAAHYLQKGWQDNLDPGPRFSNRFYLAHHGDVRQAERNPLAHYLRYGAAEGRKIATPRDLAEAPSCPTDAEWIALLAQCEGIGRVSAAVDVIVPVYKGKAETLRCIYTVLQSRQRTTYRLVVLDDCGPDADLRSMLNWLGDKGVLDLYTFAENRGFVRAVNFGMRLHPDRDVVLLNSDTAVFNDWLDRLHAAAYRSPRTATVTPFSNNAEICSYPVICEDNVFSLELADEELDRLAAACNSASDIELPTGVGFCMYVRRACLDEIGMLDEEAFGRGYGEENDWCRRAHHAGWRNRLAADVFVRHHGAVSFGSEKLARIAKAVEQVESRNPGYKDAVAEFCRRDPAMPFRRSLDLARLKRYAADGAILLVTHNLGGGTERHVADLERILQAAGHCTFRCMPSDRSRGRLTISHKCVGHVPNVPDFDLSTEIEACAETMSSINVRHVHFHHFVGMPDGCVKYLSAVCRAGGLSYDVTLHDYMAVCPRINLIDQHGVYCAELSKSECESCVQRSGSPFGKPRVWEWRETSRTFLGEARRIFVPDADVRHRMVRYFPGLTFEVKPHPESSDDKRFAGNRSHPRRTHGRTIAIVGAIGPHKGSNLLLECARLASEEAPEMRFVIIGYTNRDDDFSKLRNTRVLGRYAEEHLQDILAEEDPDICWFPSVWPETYCYTLSSALLAGVFPVAFDLGAPARRIREVGWGHLMPMTAMLDPREIISCLSTVTIPIRPAKLMANVTYENPLASYYGFTEAALSRCATRGDPPMVAGRNTTPFLFNRIAAE